MSTASSSGGEVTLDAKKGWVTSAREATDYVWSSKPTEGSEVSTLWLVPAKSAGMSTPAPFNGLGLRGNDSTPVTASGVKIPLDNRLGGDGEGFGIMMGTVLPQFNLMIAAGALGLMAGALVEPAASRSSMTPSIASAPSTDGWLGSGHKNPPAVPHRGVGLSDLPEILAYLARIILPVAVWLPVVIR